MLPMPALLESNVPSFPVRRDKVRDVYDLGDRLAVVATDRISAFDRVMPTPVPGEGELLTPMSRFWFARLGVPNHVAPNDTERLRWILCVGGPIGAGGDPWPMWRVGSRVRTGEVPD